LDFGADPGQIPEPADHRSPPGLDFDLLERLHRAVSALPDRQRQVVTLYYLEGLSWPEVGERIGLAEGTLRFHHRRAMAALRLELASLDP
jgi:RNA polymerase sigma factor (sigma-70 family)